MHHEKHHYFFHDPQLFMVSFNQLNRYFRLIWFMIFTIHILLQATYYLFIQNPLISYLVLEVKLP